MPDTDDHWLRYTWTGALRAAGFGHICKGQVWRDNQDGALVTLTSLGNTVSGWRVRVTRNPGTKGCIYVKHLIDWYTLHAQPTVQPGQVWEDCDRRANGRAVRVLDITTDWAPHGRTPNGTPYARVELVNHRGRPAWGHENLPRAEPGRETYIRLDRFRPTSSGYRLIIQTPKEASTDART